MPEPELFQRGNSRERAFTVSQCVERSAGSALELPGSELASHGCGGVPAGGESIQAVCWPLAIASVILITAELVIMSAGGI